MKKFLAFTFSLTLASIVSAASLPIQLCTPNGAFGQSATPYGTPVVATCPSFTTAYTNVFGVAPAAGIEITGAELSYQGTISFGTMANNTINFTFNPANTLTSTWTNDPTSFNVSCPAGAQPCVGGPGLGSSAGGAPFSNFLHNTTSVTMNATNTVGAVQSADARTLITFTYNDSAVPEPGTFAVVGIALMGLAVATRRRRS